MLASLLGIAVTGYGALCAVVYVMQDGLTYFPDHQIVLEPSDLGLDFEPFELDLGQTSVTGWIVRSPEENAPWVVQFHGNGGNISGRVGHLALFQKLGFNGVVFDYRGYGKSRGRPSEPGLFEDALAVRTYLLEEQNVGPDNLVYFGESLGGGVACALAEKHPPAGLILKSTFTSVPDVGAEVYPFLPVRILARNRFASKSRVPTFQFPILVVHGRGDEVVPFHHGQRLFELANEPKQWLEIGGGHNTGPLELGSEFATTVQEFVLKSCGRSSASTVD